MGGDAESRCRIPHGQPFAILLCGKLGVDSMHPPKRADAMRGPRFALTGPHAHAIQRRRDVLVGPSGRHASHDRQGFVGRLASMLAGLGLADTELSMLPAARW